MNYIMINLSCIFVCWEMGSGNAATGGTDSGLGAFSSLMVTYCMTHVYMCMYLEKGRFCDGKYVNILLNASNIFWH